MNIEPHKITRVEVIDQTGRILVKTDLTVSIVVQDDERTLKVFIAEATHKKKNQE